MLRDDPRRRPEAGPPLIEADARKALLLEESPGNVTLREELAIGREVLGRWRAFMGQDDAAEADYRSAIALFDAVIAADPATPHYGIERSRARVHLADLLLRLGRLDEALGLLDAARPPIDAAMASNPDNGTYHGVLREAIGTRARARARRGDLAAVREAAGELAGLGLDPAADASFESAALALAAALAPPAEAEALADQAVDRLRIAAEGGAVTVDSLDEADDLDALRDRDDFRAIRLDLAFPDEPFAEAP